MSDTGLRMTLVDGTTIATPSTGRSILFPDVTTGTFSVKESSGVVTPWGSPTPIAATVKSSAFSVTDADNLRTYDCQGAYAITLSDGVTAGVKVYFIHSLAGQVQEFTPGDTGSMVSSLGSVDPIFYSQQGRTLQAESLGNNLWYISGVLSPSISDGDIPLSIPNLITWYPFDRAATVSGLTADQAPVVDIIDQSTIGEDLNQATGSNQAVLNTNAQNGLTALRFDETDMYPLTATQLVIPSGNNTFFAVAWQVQEQSNQYIIGMDASTDDWGVRVSAGQYEYNQGGVIKESSRDTTIPSVIIGTRNGTALKIYNGNTQTGSNSNGSSPTVSDGALGGRGGTSQRWDGWIAEIVIYNRILTTVERQTVTNYLGSKWNVSV